MKYAVEQGIELEQNQQVCIPQDTDDCLIASRPLNSAVRQLLDRLECWMNHREEQFVRTFIAPKKRDGYLSLLESSCTREKSSQWIV